jgi:hypothetical protein
MLSTGNLRKNHKYVFENYGEKTSFVVLDFLPDNNYQIELIDSLEIIEFKQLTQFGISTNYQLHELTTHR